MNTIYSLKNRLLLAFFCLSALIGYAQQGRLPTAEELSIKANLLKVYTSGSYQNRSTPNHIMVTGPEQNCNNAIPVCQQTYNQTASYTGPGSIQEVASSTCLQVQETNSVWYIFTVQNSGTFTFLLNTANDYDFAMYDITSIGCAGVPSATPIRCNFSATYGNTGLTLPTAGGNLSYNASQGPTMPGINVTAGQTFALIIDNYSANTNGYTLTFGGTAQIFDNTPPAFTTLTAPCNSNTFNVSFSEPVKCNSIAANGSDFTITGPGSINVPVTSAVGNLCSGAANTNFATVTFNNTGLPTGTYTVNINTGSDGNTISDKCNNLMTTPQTITFQYLAPISIIATNTLVCAGGPTTLTVSGTGSVPVVYSWAPVSSSSPSITVNPTADITYIATVTYGGCSQSVSQAISVSAAPLVSINPNNISLCSGTTTLIATSTINNIPCTSCNYTWSGSSTQTNASVPGSTVTGAGAGSYSVSVTSPIGCPGNTAVSNVTIVSPTSSPACNIIYVSPAGGGSGTTPATPTDIQTALGLAACNNVVIKMQIGDYTINNPLNMLSFTTVEGGYNVGFTTKTSGKATTGGFPAQGTRIIRSGLNPEGPLGNQRFTALNIGPGSSFFRIQDIRIDMPNNAAGTGYSNYAVYLGNACSDYNITRCYIATGNAGSGLSGTSSTVVANNGGNGGYGTAGDNDDDFDAGAGGGGGGGGGTTIGGNGGNATGSFNSANNCTLFGGAGGTAGITAGNGGVGASDINGCSGHANGNPGSAGLISTDIRSGGGGGGGASGGEENRPGGAGGVGGGVLSTYGDNTTGGGAGGGGGSGGGSAGAAGSVGAAGIVGAAGTVGTAGSDASGFWVVGTQGGTGGNGTGGQGGKGGGGGGGQGCGLCIDGSGSGGGGGGGGGQGGVGGTGGFGGGSTFGIFSFNNGANGFVVDCEIITGTAGAGGTGGAGSTGGNGGTGGSGSPYTGGGEVGAGGNGGNGGKGGNGGAGGSGTAGIANAVRLVGGTALVSNISNFTLLAQTVITAENKACTNVPISHATAATSPAWTAFGAGSTPASGTGSPLSTSYSTLGRKTVAMNATNYTDFNNIIVSPPATGNIIASATNMCPGTANFSSSVLGTAGLNYSWSVSPAGATISTPSVGTTAIAFTNNSGAPITYTVTLNILSQCCGTLLPITTTIVIESSPVAPTGIVNAICMGGTATFTATAPTGASFNWYNAASTGTLLASGTTYSMPNVLTTSTVYLQATNSSGCSSTLTPVVVTPTVVPAPTVIPATACDIGLINVGINPVAGAVSYNWFADAAGTTTVQSGSSLSYGQNIGTPGGSYTVYVQSAIPGCLPSALVPVTASVSTTPILASANYTPNDTVCVNTLVTIALNTSGGNGTFTYTWSPISSNSGTISTVVGASTSYNVFIESNGCSKLFYFPVIVSGPKDTIVPPASLTCTNTAVTLDGSFSASGPNYIYSWTTTNGNITTSTTSSTVSVNSAGTYSLAVTDIITGCMSIQFVTVNATNVPPTVLVATPSTISCTTNTIALNGTGSSAGPGITYNWTTTGGVISAGTNSLVATANAPGTYTLTITDSNTGCSSSATTVISGSIAIPDLTVPAASFPCGAGSTVISANSSAPGVTYVWTGPNSTSVISGGNTNSPTIGDQGTYTVTVTDPVSGCSNTSTVSVSQNTINAAFTADPTSGVAPLTVNLTNQSSGSSMTYDWSFGNGEPNATTANPSTTYNNTGTYTVTLIVTSGACKDTVTTIIVVEQGLTLEIPNVFTPNADGKNDFFTIKSTGVKEMSLQIFNRWGEKLYEFTGTNAAWDGLTQHGLKVPDATYFYFVNATGYDDKKVEKHGSVNLFR